MFVYGMVMYRIGKGIIAKSKVKMICMNIPGRRVTRHLLPDSEAEARLNTGGVLLCYVVPPLNPSRRNRVGQRSPVRRRGISYV
jgi:hypothetical protein